MLRRLREGRIAIFAGGSQIVVKGVALIHAEARHMAMIFLGRTEGYEPKAWNAPGKLDQITGWEIELIKAPEENMVRYFTFVANNFWDICDHLELRKDIDEDTAWLREQHLVETTVTSLIGLRQ